MANILITGHKGFIAQYVATRLLEQGHKIFGVDDGSKHGYNETSLDKYIFGFCLDAANYEELASKFLSQEIDIIIANAALIGGIKYFHDYQYDIIAENNAILDSTIKLALAKKVKQLVYFSSSMVYESANIFPSKEGDELICPPPKSTYGFQKLTSEYMVRGAHEQYGLDYTIIRPFNAVGKGEVNRPDEPGFSHVIPDFITKIKNKRVLEVFGDGNQIRSFTHAKDIADGVLMCLENKAALNNDFNFVTEEPITMLNLARKLWGMLRKDDFVYNTKATNFIHDVKKRQGTYEKAERVLGWKPKFNLDDTLKEMVEFYG